MHCGDGCPGGCERSNGRRSTTHTSNWKPDAKTQLRAHIIHTGLTLTPGTRLGVYEITALLGEGGMGAVYRATDTSLRRQVAIKVLPDAFADDADRVARFEREAIAFTDAGAIESMSVTNIKLFDQTQSRNGVTPLCAIGNKGLYIDARGSLFPCCWVANRYNHNSDWQQLAENFNLHTKTLITVLADTFWATEFQTFKWQECQTKCKTLVVDKKYATSW